MMLKINYFDTAMIVVQYIFFISNTIIGSFSEVSENNYLVLKKHLITAFLTTIKNALLFM